MKDAAYVQEVLKTDFKTERSNEIPYPDLHEVISELSFDFQKGVVEGERPNGSQSREGKDYLWFTHGKKSILTHRFLAAVALGMWPPRDFDVDHVNHDPSDNRPTNLRVVTPRDNAGNRRKALLSDLADLDAVSSSVMEIAKLREKKRQAVNAADDRHIERPVQPEPELEPYIPQPIPEGLKLTSKVDPDDHSFSGRIPRITYTGETKPAKYGGAWHKTNLGSWHLKYD